MRNKDKKSIENKEILKHEITRRKIKISQRNISIMNNLYFIYSIVM